MSTVAYAELTNRRDEAEPNTSSAMSPGVGSYVDALAALVPAEVLSLHALVISATTAIAPDGTTSTITAVAVLKWAFFGFIALSVFLYVVPRAFGGRWDPWDYVRAAIPPLAFVGWTMLQRTTAFDAAFPTLLSESARTVIALFLAALLVFTATALSYQVDRTAPPKPKPGN
ncbi:MAG TPA: hypothetical protein VNZ53_03525 [Steroidobacteraceae bacterium]|jgi:hypothetical protein|nr:hypothetical protein [Steroidobacteraceae bacterium]